MLQRARRESPWHDAIYDEIETLVKSDCTVTAGMSAIVAECARHRPHEDWDRFGTLDIASDLEHLRTWLTTAFSTPPAGPISGLWFGLCNPVYEGKDSADIYVSGSPDDPAGDLICIGNLTHDGLQFSRDSFDWATNS